MKRKMAFLTIQKYSLINLYFYSFLFKNNIMKKYLILYPYIEKIIKKKIKLNYFGNKACNPLLLEDKGVAAVVEFLASG